MLRTPRLVVLITKPYATTLELIDDSFTPFEIDINESTIISSFESSVMNTYHIHYMVTEDHPEILDETPFKQIKLKPTMTGFHYLSSIEEIKETRYCGQAFQSFILLSSSQFIFFIDQVIL